MPRQRDRRVRADRPRRVGARGARAPPPANLGRASGGRRARWPPAADVERGRRDLALPTSRGDAGLLPERRGRRGRLRPRGHRHARDDLRQCALPRGRLRRHPARDDLPVRPRRAAAAPRVRVARADRDPAPLPQRLRPAARARAVLPPRHPPAHRAADSSREGRLRRQGARPRRLPDLRARLPPVRRGRLGRVRLPVDVLDPRLRADHRPDPHAAAVAPDVRGPQLRHLLVLSPEARLRPARDPDPVPPLERELRGDDLLRLRQLLLAEGGRRRLGDAAPVGHSARAAPRARREVDRHDRDARAGGDVRHVPPAAADDVRPRPRRRHLRVLVAATSGAASTTDEDPAGVTSHL